MTRKNNSIFHTELADGVFQLSSKSDGMSLSPGKPSRNSYLIIGESKALLFDLALEEDELCTYAHNLASKDMIIALSHAHIDHIYNIENITKIMMHPDDVPLLLKGSIFQPPLKKIPEFTCLNDGDVIDLGNRKIDIIHIPGHTDGSILLFDRKTGFLFSGDTVTRRLLYGMHSFVPIETFCYKLEDLKKLNITNIYSAHDRCALPFEHIDYMISLLKQFSKSEGRILDFPFFEKAEFFSDGNENEISYFDFTVVRR